jgi:hypothetical protein
MERDLLSCTALASYDAQIDGIRDPATHRLESLNASWQDFELIQSAQSLSPCYLAGYAEVLLLLQGSTRPQWRPAARPVTPARGLTPCS